MRQVSETNRIVINALPSQFKAHCSSGWLYWTGCAGLALAAFLLFPGNPVWDLSQARIPNAILVYVSLIFLMWGIYQDRDRFTTWVANRPRWIRLAWTIGIPIGWIALLRLINEWAPAYLDSIAREWGLIEPFTLGLYWVAMCVTLSWARIRREQGQETKPYQALAVLFGMAVLEECDYLGIFGGIFGRIEGVYVGTPHDLVTLWYRTGQHLGWASGAALLGVVVGAWLWRRGYCSWAFLWRETWTVTSIPALCGAALMAMAQIGDVDKRMLGPLRIFWCGSCEESLEFLFTVLLFMSVLLKVSRDYRRTRAS